jgi:hypothetical protein
MGLFGDPRVMKMLLLIHQTLSTKVNKQGLKSMPKDCPEGCEILAIFSLFLDMNLFWPSVFKTVRVFVWLIQCGPAPHYFL